MTENYISRIFYWTNFCQRKYKKKFKKYNKNHENFKNFEKITEDNQDKVFDSRVYLGSLRYIPFSILSLLKNLPSPWESNNSLPLIIHENKSLLIIQSNSNILPEFSSTLWNLIWILNRKEKINRINFQRVNFPPFEDEEYWTDLKLPKDFNISSLIVSKNLENYLKVWFCAVGNLVQNWANTNKRTLIYSDNSLRISLNKLEIQSGLYFNKNTNHFEKYYKFFPTLSPFATKFISFDNESNQKKILKFIGEYFSPLFSFFNQIKKSSSRKILKIEQLNYRFSFKISNKISFSQNKFFKQFKGLKYLKKSNKKMILKTINKKEIFLFEMITPFFMEIFLSQKRLSFYLKFRYDFPEVFSPFFFSIPAWNNLYMERILINLSRPCLPYLSLSYLSLIKYLFSTTLKKKKTVVIRHSLNEILTKNLFFQRIKSTWVNVGKEICLQSHKLLSMLIKRKGIEYLNLDFNFNLKPVRTLSTRERKKSRFSNTFHFFREFLRLMKLLIDCHIKFYSGFIDFYQLSDSIHFLLTHIGKVTGIYRYKYKIMKQIKMCKSIKKILYKKFYDFPVPLGPGFGFWAPVWKVWVFFLRGMVPIQERWIANLLSRHLYGRRYSRKSLSVTKQRSETYLDIELKIALVNEINNLKKHKIDKKDLKLYLKQSNEAWKSWKSNNNWNPTNLSGEIESLILDYIKTKSIWWIRAACLVRESIIKGIPIEKSKIKKNLGRITRLWFKAEQSRQLEYLKNGPYLTKNNFFSIEAIFNYWIEICHFQKIQFPKFKNRWDLKILILSLDQIKENGPNGKMEWNTSSLQQTLLSKAMNDPLSTFLSIKDSILTQRLFFEIGLNFIDNFFHLCPVYIIDFAEKITDSYIDQYIWYECDKKLLFPPWVKPSDLEINPYFIYKLQKKIYELIRGENFSEGNRVNIGKLDFMESSDNCDLILLSKILNKILDSNVVSYLTSKNNIKLIFKDMFSLNSIGIIRGVHFGGFLIQLYYFLFDLLILGIKNSLFLIEKNLKFLNRKKSYPFIFYNRYISKTIFISISINCLNLKDFLVNSLDNFPSSLGTVKLKNVSEFQNLSNNNDKNLPVSFCGFSLFIIEQFNLNGAGKKNFIKKRKFLKTKISQFSIFQLECRIKQIILNSGSTAFTKMSNKWNSVILGVITYFREFANKNQNFLKILCKSEEKMQIRIKTSFNSKMPSRFPLLIFFAPKELGGLGMISVSRYLIPDNDLKFKKFIHVGKKSTEDFKNEPNIIPIVMDFIANWDIEFENSKKAWKEFIKRRTFFKTRQKIITFEDLEDLWEKGIPRINTLFQKDREILAFDHGWRLRKNMEKFQTQKTNPFWWTIKKHDGKLWDLNSYKIEILKKLGGLTNILEHSLFKGTYFPTWEGLFWEKSSGFEEMLENKKLTRAQRSGLNQIPNRRFTLWWSPTINRANIFIGFQVQLDLTGIFMHGKIPTLKISLIQIFRAHLWQKIHQSIVLNLCNSLEKHLFKLEIASIRKEHVHPRKSYKINSSCADILLISEKVLNISKPSLISSKLKDSIFKNGIGTNFWIDLQLRWGDFDSHDIERHAREKFLDFTLYQNGSYPCNYGIIVAIDLSYNLFSGFGFGFPRLKEVLNSEFTKIMRGNSALYILRDRIRKSLQLYTKKIPEINLSLDNFSDIFKIGISWLIDDSLFYRVSVHQTLLGNIKTKPINGVITIFIPKNGNLILRIINSNIWKQQKRLSQLARWKASEEIFNFLKIIPSEELPDQLILLRKTLKEPLEIQLVEFPTILVRCSNFKISFQSLLTLRKINEKISSNKTHETIFFNLYDNWIKSVSPFTAFSRLVLILRGLELNKEKTKKILGLSLEFSYKTNFWPLFTDEEWVKNEIFLKDLVLEEFTLKNKIDLESLFETEIRDIVFGCYKKDFQEFSPKEKNEKNSSKTISSSKTFGKKIKTVILSKNWKNFIEIGSLKKNIDSPDKKLISLKKIQLKKKKFIKDSNCYIFPKNLLKTIFLNFSKGWKNIFMVFGKFSKSFFSITEIRLLILISDEKEIFERVLIKCNQDLRILKSLDFLGYLIKNQGKEESRDFLNSFVKNYTSISGKLFSYISLVFIYISINQGNIQINALEYKKRSKILNDTSILLTKKYFGLILNLFKINFLL